MTTWAIVALLGVITMLVTFVWAAARQSARADYERGLARLAKEAEDIAREVRRDIAREPDPNQRLRDDWTRD